METYLQMEKAVLATMLSESYLLTDSGVRKDYFTSRVHQNIFTCMEKQIAKNRPVDDVTLLTMMDPEGLGGANYVMDLKNYVRPAKFPKYVEVIREGWKEREKTKTLVAAIEQDWTIPEIQRVLDEVEKEGNTNGETSIRKDLIRMGERPFEEVEDEPTVPTGLEPLDTLLNGFQPAELTIIAGRPSMGKTDALNHFAIQAGIAGYQPIIFSLEMSKKSMIDRLISATGGYGRLRMRNPYKHFTKEQKARWLEVLGNLDYANIHIDDRAGIQVTEMRAVTRKIVHENPTMKPIIFIDYLQIIRGSDRFQNRTELVGEISNALKQMAKEFNCPVVCLSQLNRSVEARDDKRPRMSDLRDSGNIEQDADVIGFLYRDDYYNPDTTQPNILEIQIGKNRNGPTGTVYLNYIKETGVLYDRNWKRT